VSATATRIQSPEQLGRAIRARRRELHLTQQTVADLIAVNRIVVGKIEHGKSTVQLRIVLLVVQVLGMDFELRTRGRARVVAVVEPDAGGVGAMTSTF
jgi:HTH-type transcriptional regulator / antitoxin HipB